MWRAGLKKASVAAGKLLGSTKSVQDFAAAIYFAATKSGLLKAVGVAVTREVLLQRLAVGGTGGSS